MPLCQRARDRRVGRIEPCLDQGCGARWRRARRIRAGHARNVRPDQLARQPPRSAALLIVHSRGMGLKDKLDGHRGNPMDYGILDAMPWPLAGTLGSRMAATTGARRLTLTSRHAA
jgi:hypothetical protein